MSLVVFLRGVNVGGHRRVRPSVLAKELSDYDVVNVGAAGTFVVRKPVGRAQFCAALRRLLPFEAEIAMCDGRELIRLERENSFGSELCGKDVVRFISVLVGAGRAPAGIPFSLPPGEEWLVRIVGSQGRFIFGEYRRAMKTIGYLGQLDKRFGAAATTRNWNTVLAILRVLKG